MTAANAVNNCIDFVLANVCLAVICSCSMPIACKSNQKGHSILPSSRESKASVLGSQQKGIPSFTRTIQRRRHHCKRFCCCCCCCCCCCVYLCVCIYMRNNRKSERVNSSCSDAPLGNAKSIIYESYKSIVIPTNVLSFFLLFPKIRSRNIAFQP